MAKITKPDLSGAKAVFGTPAGSMAVENRGNGVVRICIGASEAKGGYTSSIGIPPALNPPGWLFSEKEASFDLSAGTVNLSLQKNDGRLVWHTAGGRPLLSQPFPELSAEPVIKYKSGKSALRTVETVDGERSFADDLIPWEDGAAFRAKVFFDFQGDEGLHGLGQAEEGIYNYRGKIQYLYQHNMRIPIPFLLSDQGYGLLFDCGCLMTFNDGGMGSYIFLDTVDALDFYFIHAETPGGIIARLRELTGPAPLLPKWAFGYIQSREAYHTQEELVDTARQYRARHIPLDCVVQDWNTWEPNKWGNKKPDKTRYPDIARANQQLHDMQVHSMVSVWPNMKAGCEDHGEFAKAGLLLLDNATYNAFDGEARRLYWRQAASELFAGGFDSWWCDSSEPFTGPDWNGDVLREPWERFSLVGGEHKKYLGPERANLYALEHAKGIYQNQRAENSEKRVFNLTRSGWAGSQRYGAAVWSGDTSARWDTLKKQITEGLNLCMSGLPWWTLDIGGFFTIREKWQNRGCGMNKNPKPLWFWRGDFEDGVKDPGYRELYVRWLQMGAFLPLFRSHGTDTPREIWHFGEPGSPFYDAIEAFIRLRYRLMPYIYSLAGAVALKNDTMMRSLLFDFASDETAQNISGQFMFGGAFLVCPVTEPLYYAPGGAPLQKNPEWRCYLPAGMPAGNNPGWYDFWTGTNYPGGQWINVPAPLERMPLFVRAGSIVPMETAPLEYAGQVTKEAMEIQVYPGSDGKFTLYEDSGDGYGYEEGKYNSIELEWSEAEQTLSIGGAAYDFPQSLRGRACRIRIGSLTREITYRGEAMQIKNWTRSW
jgi:alpha-D-xyloside xylohydrolase